MQLELIGKCEELQDVEGIRKIIKEVAIEKQMKVIELEDMMVLEICPLGKIHYTSEELLFSLEANTDFAGAGFHDFVSKYYENLMIRLKDMVELQMIDPSGYDIHRNFDRLKIEYENWMRKLCENITNLKDLSWLALGLSDQGYLPKQIDGYVNTHMSRKSFDYFKKNLKQVCDELFIWNEKGPNAAYYRNCAYYLLYVEHYDDYYLMNEEVAHDIVSYLESAYALDPKLALPLDVYDELCLLLNRKKGLENAIFDDLEIKGYRLEDVYYPLNHFYVLNDGHCEVNYDDTSATAYFMAPYKSIEEGWSYMYMMTLSPSKELKNSFSSNKLTALAHDTLKIKYYIEKDDIYHVHAMCKHDKQQLYIHAVLKDESMIDICLNRLQQTKYFETK